MPIRPVHYFNVWCLLLLLSISAQAARDLRADADRQQQTMLAQHGRNCSAHWQQRCQTLIQELQLQQFNTCIITNANHPNAYALANGNLLLTRGLIQATRNPDQLAHVLAHEHAHLVLEHHQQTADLIANPPVFFTKSKIKKHYQRIELAADAHADVHLLKHQRDPKQIKHYLLRLDPETQKHSVSHPKLARRIKSGAIPPEVLDANWVAALDLLVCE